MVIRRDGCPQCGSTHYKKNGHTYNGKQNHRCKACSRQFVREFQQRRIPGEHRALIERLLNERLSLRGICRAVGVGMKWLMAFLVECYETAPTHLNVQLPPRRDPLLLVHPLQVEADELCSFVGKKANKQWLWLALDTQSRQVLAFHVGDRSCQSARQLWDKLPAAYRQHATFYTDAYAPYGRVIPETQHRAVTKEARNTNHLERFNGTLRQRVSRLVRSALSFSKNLAHHIGAIRYFLCHYNLTRAARCKGQPISP
jgi:insertion element IS1 protein InsB